MISESINRFDTLHNDALTALKTFVDVVMRPDDNISLAAIEAEADAFVVELSWHASFHRYVVQLIQRLADLKTLHSVMQIRDPAQRHTKKTPDKRGVFGLWRKDEPLVETVEANVQALADVPDFEDGFKRRVAGVLSLQHSCSAFLDDRIYVLTRSEFVVKEQVVNMSRTISTLEGEDKSEAIDFIQYMEEIASAVRRQRAKLNWFKHKLASLDYQAITGSHVVPDVELRS